MITVLGRGLWAVMLVSVNFGLHAQTLDQQEKCVSLARKAFNEDEAKNKAFLSYHPEIDVLSSNYQGHYNPKLDRCLMLVTRTWTRCSNCRTGETSYLFDVIEGRRYAYYENEGDEKPFCRLNPSSMKATPCNTSAEFREFVAGYME